MGRLDPAFTLAGEREPSGEEQRPIAPESPHPFLLNVGPTCNRSPSFTFMHSTQKRPETPALWCEVGNRQEGSCEAPSHLASVSYSMACLRFQKILRHPTPERAPTPSVRGRGCDYVWSNQRQLEEDEAGPFPPFPLPDEMAKRWEIRKGLISETERERHIALTALNEESQCTHEKFRLLSSYRSGDLLQS